jgi:diguanylate cyclase (GGDEF)-like protein
MPESESQRSTNSSARWKRVGAWGGALAALGGVALVAWVWRLVLGRFGEDAVWLMVQAPLTICAGTLAWRFAAGHEHRWVQPTRQLHRLIEEIRLGQAPIDDLSAVTGPLAPLAMSARQTLIELRRQKQVNARLQAEQKDHVRSRTEILERKMNTWQQKAHRDPLTGLCNRRALDEQLPAIVERCRSGTAPMCILAIDVDHFKNVNDTHGHAVGDRLLRDVGQLIRSAVRDEDWAFRVGGDEFLIVLPGHDWPSGKKLARRLVALAEQLAVTIRTNPRPGLSVGIICPDNLRNLTPHDLLHQADEAMYREKAVRKRKAG